MNSFCIPMHPDVCSTSFFLNETLKHEHFLAINITDMRRARLCTSCSRRCLMGVPGDNWANWE